MITRAYLHVAGPAGVGKTAFVEALLRKIDAWVLVARCVRDDALNEAREWVPDVDPELARYEAAGADGVARFAFPTDRAEEEDFFLTDLMADHSEAVVLEGDCPLAHVDLRVFVSPPLPNGGSLFVRARRDRSSEDRRQDEIVERVFREPGGVEALLEEQLGSGFVEAARRHPEAFDRIRADLLAAIRQARETPRPPVEHWAVAHGHAGIERAQLVVVNVRDEGERENGERLVTDLLRLRKDDEIFNHILGVRGTRIPVTAVVANLRDRNDRGLGKAIARVKRAIRIGSSA